MYLNNSIRERFKRVSFPFLLMAKQIANNVVSLGAGIGAYFYAQKTLDLTKEAMELIKEEFTKSGAENVQIQETGITNFSFNAEDLTGTNLTRLMDFSSIPALYVHAGDFGYKVALASAIIGGVAGLITGKDGSTTANGLVKTGRRMGEGYGLGRLIAAKAGLENIDQYTITNPAIDTFTLAEYSQKTRLSAVDIAPIVQSGLETLAQYTLISGLVIGGVELGLEAYEYSKNKRLPSQRISNYSEDSLGTNQTYKPANKKEQEVKWKF